MYSISLLAGWGWVDNIVTVPSKMLSEEGRMARQPHFPMPLVTLAIASKARKAGDWAQRWRGPRAWRDFRGAGLDFGWGGASRWPWGQRMRVPGGETWDDGGCGVLSRCAATAGTLLAPEARNPRDPGSAGGRLRVMAPPDRGAPASRARGWREGRRPRWAVGAGAPGRGCVTLEPKSPRAVVQPRQCGRKRPRDKLALNLGRAPDSLFCGALCPDCTPEGREAVIYPASRPYQKSARECPVSSGVPF
jgi:hypothetical protein